MKVLQIVTTYGQYCGIAFFASNLQEQMEKIGIEVKTVSSMNGDLPNSDIILLHYHSELINVESIIELCKKNCSPVVLFAHSDGDAIFIDRIKGFVTMCPGMIPGSLKPVFLFPHPAWVPKSLDDRTLLRNQFGLPDGSVIIGTNGLLKFERQFVEILLKLLPHAKNNGWYINILTSPWYIDSPGLIAELKKIESMYSSFFRFENTFMDEKILNKRLQACDILWCWTKAPSSPYASGVISHQYASGTRIFAADKLQHNHVLLLPNVARGPNELEPFVEQLILEIKRCKNQRHDPSLISWDRFINKLTLFLTKIYTERKANFN